MKEKSSPLTIKEAIQILQSLDPESILITERSLSDSDGVRIVPQSSDRVLIF